MTTTTRLTALALAAAAFTTATALAGTASANSLIKKLPPGAFKGINAPKPPPASGIIAKLPPGELGTIIAKEPPSTTGGQTSGIGGIIAKLPPGTLCLVGSPCGPKLGPPPPPVHPCPLTTGCSGPPRGPLPIPVGGGGDHGDHDGHHDGYHDGHGYYRFGHYRERPEIVVEGAPGTVAVAAPVAAPQAVAQAPCNCLTKQNLADGSVLFQDICTKESALAPAPGTSLR